MTPRRLDWRAVEPKLRRINGLLRTLDSLGPVDERRLRGDELHSLAVERILTLIVDLAFAINGHVAAAVLGHAPTSYAESFGLAADAGLITTELADALKPSAGLRNVLVHGYLDVDYRHVAAAVPLAVRDFGEYVRQAAGWVDEHGTG